MARILVVRVLGLGDLLTAVPALRGLRRALPDDSIELASPGWLRPLLPLVGAVDDLVEVADLAGLGPLDPPPGLAVNLHGRGPQSIEAAVRSGAAGIITHRHPAFPALAGPDWDPDAHEVVRWCRLLGWAGLPADPTDLRLDRPAVAPAAVGCVVLHPGASAAARRWPVQRFGAVAAALAGDGYDILVTGTSAETGLADRVVTCADNRRVGSVAGRLDLAGLAALVAAAALVISGDTGVAHLASAYETPSVLLFGPTPPQHWGPPATGPHTVLWHGGRGDPHSGRPDPGLLAISTEEVVRAGRAALRGPAGCEVMPGTHGLRSLSTDGIAAQRNRP